MSDPETPRRQNGVVDSTEDIWSDVDESLLALCDHLEGEESLNKTTCLQTDTTAQTSSNGEEDNSKPCDINSGPGPPSAQVSGNSEGDSCNLSDTTSRSSPAWDKVVSNTDGGTNTEGQIKGMGEVTPLHMFNKGDYLCVTDLTQQLWCEQHLCYTLMGVEPQLLSALDAETANIPLPVPAADRPEVKAGKSVHLARELEVHDIVNVKISSRADKWALHILNLLTSVRGFLAGAHVAREVPIFGDPFGTGDLFFGIIDELRFDAEKYSLGLVELKTRKTKRMPGKAQKKQHFLQVQIYKQLWDNLVKGNFSTNFFLTKLDLIASASEVLSQDVVQHIKTSATSASSLGELLSQLTMSAQALVCITSMEIEYVLQDTGSVIGQLTVEEDFERLWRMFCHCMDFWHGRREQEGVSIEEAWKCGGCEFSNMCEWRIRKSNMLATNNCCSALDAS